MRQLQPAGFWSTLITSLFPKTLNVELRTQALSDGTVEVVPVYTIDGQLVPAESLTSTASQNVLGYTIVKGNDAIHVLKETGGKRVRLSKHKAAAFLSGMSQKGVRLKAKGKDVGPRLVR